MVVQIVQMARRGAGGLFRVHAVVGGGGLLQAVFLAAELARTATARRSALFDIARGRKPGFRLRQENQFLRDAFLGQDPLDQGLVAARAAQAASQDLLAACRWRNN